MDSMGIVYVALCSTRFALCDFHRWQAYPSLHSLNRTWRQHGPNMSNPLTWLHVAPECHKMTPFIHPWAQDVHPPMIRSYQDVSSIHDLDVGVSIVMGVPINAWYIKETPLKWMNGWFRGYPYFRKPPCIWCAFLPFLPARSSCNSSLLRRKRSVKSDSALRWLQEVPCVSNQSWVIPTNCYSERDVHNRE